MYIHLHIKHVFFSGKYLLFIIYHFQSFIFVSRTFYIQTLNHQSLHTLQLTIISLSLSLSIYLFIYLSIFLCIYLSIYQSIYTSRCVLHLFFLYYLYPSRQHVYLQSLNEWKKKWLSYKEN